MTFSLNKPYFVKVSIKKVGGKMPKFCPRGLWMTPLNLLERSMTVLIGINNGYGLG